VDRAPDRAAAGPARSSVFGLIRRRFFAFLLPLLIVPAAALAFSLAQEKEYEASTTVVIRDSGGNSPLASENPDREAATNLRLLQLGAVQARVNDRLGGPFKGDVDVVTETESNLATITVTGPDPEEAARVANTYADEYIELREEIKREEIAEQETAVMDKLAALPRAARRGSEGQALKNRLEELSVAEVTSTGAKQLGKAEPPTAASSPGLLRNTAIGALVGLALGALLAIVLEQRDRRVRDPRYLEQAFGRPLVGRIPKSRALAKSSPGTAELPLPAAEAFRNIRANLRHQLREQNARSVLVTSASPGEGKTTVVWNLARMAAASGAKVLLVEADLRRPVLARSLGANGAPGLSELLSGERQLQDVIQSVSFENHTNGTSTRETIDVLFAGKPSASPAELLDSERMQAVLDVVPDGYDLVVVDTPPAVIVSDAMPMLGRVGGVLVVGRIGLSTHESIIELRNQLDNLDAPTLGVIINGDSAADSHRYYASTAQG
jgi:succinoglycan biosynthesis transport protein ExoP